MDNSTLLLVVAVVLIIVILGKKAEHMDLADRLGTQNQNIEAALQQKLEIGETPAQAERFSDPYADVQKALAERRFERMCSSQNNADDPLNEALHGGSALSAM